MSDQTISTLEKIRNERIEKLEKLKGLGLNPYPAESNKEYKNSEVVEKFTEFEGKDVTLTGRLMSWRTHGPLIFADIHDQSGKIQLYIRESDLQPTSVETQSIGFDDTKLLDVGDIVEASGTVTKTQRGEISLLVKKIRILAKSLRPLPEKWKGIVDQETRYRRRYLDMTMNPEVRQRFERRARFWQTVREFLNMHGFVEVNIPVLEHTTGGAEANPFVTHMDSIDQDFYLRISQELPLKRLLGGGMEKVFDIGPRFRNEGLSDEHLPEHIAMEFYWAYADFEDGLKFTEEMFKYVMQKVYGTLKFNIKGFDVDLGQKWEVIDYCTIIKERYGVDVFETPEAEMLKILTENGVRLSGDINRNRLVDNIWKLIRKTIGGPAFVINLPKFMSPLSKSLADKPELTQRLHPMIGGSELANAFGELNDPLDQFARFKEQEDMRQTGDNEAMMMDIDFVEMLEYGMPPAFGFGFSERVFWFFENVTAKEGVPFPPVREELDPLTKKIYGLKDRREQDENSVANLGQPVGANADASSTAPAQNATLDQSAYWSTFPSIEEAEKLVQENVSDEYQRFHAGMISKIMREYATIIAEKYPEESAQNPEAFNPERWAVTGMVHDWDYSFDPEGHPESNISKLTDAGYSADITDAILGHKLSLNVPRPTRMAQALLAIDELAGLIFAYSKMKGDYASMEVKGVMKKFKDKAFAAKINRDDITTGVNELGISLEEHIANLIAILSR